MAYPFLDVEENATFVAAVVDRGISTNEVQIVLEDVVFKEGPYGVGNRLGVLLLWSDVTKKSVSRFCDEGIVVLRNSGLTATTILIRLDD